LLGKSWFYYDWEQYKTHDKIIISIAILRVAAETLYDKLKELNVNFRMKIYEPTFSKNDEIISYFKSKNRHISKRVLYLNGAWRLDTILRYKGVFIVNDENKHLLKYLSRFHHMKLEINFY